MRRHTALATTGLATAVTVVALTTGVGHAEPTELTFELHDRETSFTKIIDVRPKTFDQQIGSPGDKYAFTKSLHADSGKQVGAVYAHCTVDSPGRNARVGCEGTIELKKGTLTFTEFFQIRDRSRTIAITGGTGDYAGATGTLFGRTDKANPGAGNLLTFSLTLP